MIDVGSEFGGSTAQGAISFGPFRLLASERLLEKAGVPVHLGSRALDILIALVECAPEVVSKKSLVARVWPNVTVEEGSLRFHITTLRKALGDGEAGARYVTNVPSRGYCFVAPVSRALSRSEVEASYQVNRISRLPARAARMVGRDEAVQAISKQLTERRFVTIVGPGGIGKTTAAVSVSHALFAAFNGAVHFVDLGLIGDPAHIPTALASALGLSISTHAPISDMIAMLLGRRLLLVLDSCEHVIETVATVTETIFRMTQEVHILATSRESLRVEGEQIHRMLPLGFPSEDPALKAADAIAYPAVQLFVEGVRSSGHPFELNDSDAPVVGNICRRLDGIALALELAAASVNVYGIRGTAALLDNQFRLIWQGRRTALPRHQTLCATLDWSYNLLSDTERVIFRRLAVFVGTFSLEAAQSVVAGADFDDARVVEGIASLVTKSLVTVNNHTPETRYRLLDTTRAYALRKLDESAEREAITRRHAAYFCGFLERNFSGGALPKINGEISVYAEHVDNVRAALEWSYSERGDVDLGAALATASAPLFLELSLLGECRHWTELSIATLRGSATSPRREMELQTWLALSLTFTKGNSADISSAYTRALTLAEQLEEPRHQLRLLGGFLIFLCRIGDFSGALSIAERSSNIANDLNDPVALAQADLMRGISNHWLGNLITAQRQTEAALKRSPISRYASLVWFGFDHHIFSLVALARTLALRGFADRAVKIMRQGILEADILDHPISLCVCLTYAAPVFIDLGDWCSAEDIIERLIRHAERHSLSLYQAVGRGFEGEIAIKNGAVEMGISRLRGCLEALHSDEHKIFSGRFAGKLAEVLAATGQFEDALTAIDEAVMAEPSPSWRTPEIWRIKGQIMVYMPGASTVEAEDWLLRSLDMARKQSALAWEVKTSTSLAQLWRDQGRRGQAEHLLRILCGQISTGLITPDMDKAVCLLRELEQRPSPCG